MGRRWLVAHPAGIQSSSSRSVIAATASPATASTTPENRVRSTFAQNQATGMSTTMPIR